MRPSRFKNSISVGLTSFAPSFFYGFEDRLTLAVYDTNIELRRGYYMNWRLKDLAASREKTNLPPIELPGRPVERKAMSVTGIESGAFQTALAKMRQDIAAKQTEAVSKIGTAVAAGAAKMHAAVDDVIAKADKEVDAALHEFATFTNGPHD